MAGKPFQDLNQWVVFLQWWWGIEQSGMPCHEIPNEVNVIAFYGSMQGLRDGNMGGGGTGRTEKMNEGPAPGQASSGHSAVPHPPIHDKLVQTKWLGGVHVNNSLICHVVIANLFEKVRKVLRGGGWQRQDM